MAPPETSGSSSAPQAAGRADPETLARRLRDDKADMKLRLAAALEIKDLAETFSGPDHLTFVRHVVPAALDALAKIPCSFQTDANEQRARSALLELIHRLPQLEAARPFAKSLMQAMVRVVKEDNEDNAVTAIKIIIDLHRHLKTELEGEVAGFLAVVSELYKNMKHTIAKAFESESSQAAAAGGSAATAGSKTAKPDGASDAPSPAADVQASSVASGELGVPMASQQAPKTLVKSMSSFKVLTECPIAIVLILQTYRSNVQQAINVFVPLIIEDCLMQQAPPQKAAHDAAAAKGEVFVGVAPGIKNTALFTDLVVAQVKTMSFLAYVIKGSIQAMRPFADRLPGLAVRLLKDCPPEASATRKELLVAVRHILSTEFRVSFASQIDTLLDERVLTGTGITAREGLRPLAISMLADLMHHVRAELSPSQLERVVDIHTRTLHDTTLAPSIQTMCVKLLLNLVETTQQRHPDGATALLQAIFAALVEKLGALPRLKEDAEAYRRVTRAGDGEMDAVLIERAKPIQAGVVVADYGLDSFKDARFLFRNIFIGFKTLLPALRRRKAPEPDGAVISRLFVDGVRCWALHEHVESAQENKETMDLFTSVFLDLEPQTFHEVFTTHMGYLFEQMLVYPLLLGIPQSLLSNESVSKRFAGILLRYLVEHLDELGDADKKHASVSLRLFKMAFMAVTIFPAENEVVLQPHLSHLIMTSMKLASSAAEPTNYFLLLRALFRSIGGGRFELLYKDVLPLLQVLLENLNNLLDAAEPSKRELFVDLCLTVPVRLSVLLPYLGYLMRPLVLALQSSTELVSQGLRTLELCIDNLTQEFLDPIMAPYIYDISSALWRHLRPLPHNHQHSHTTMRILGKMGGRNRRLLQQPPHLKYGSHRPVTLPLTFDGGNAQSMSLAPSVELAVKNARSTDASHRRHAFELLKHAAGIFIDGGAAGLSAEPGRERGETLQRVIKGLFHSRQSEELAEEAELFLVRLARHVVVLEAGRESAHTRQFSPLTMHLIEGIVHALAAAEDEGLDSATVVDVELRIVREARDVCQQASRADLWHTLMHTLASKHCTLCYDQFWQRKTGGWLGMDMLVRRAELGRTWLNDHQLEIVRALLYMLKDMPTDPPANVDKVSDTLLFVLERVNAPPDASEPASDPPRPEAKALQERHFSFLVGVLVTELLSANSKVRQTARTSFELLAKLRGVGVTEILTPVKERLLQPIFAKPLRALPFGMQIGHIDAVTFCLKLDPPLPEFNEELFRVLTEALALADADDQALIGRTSQYKNMLAVTELRVVAIRLLAAAMACNDFLTQKQNAMRLRIISVYFKSLYSRSEAVVNEAYNSLRDTLQGSAKLPKDVLQGGLRPILMTLADAARLTVAGLDGLARLLELLTSYFKVEIGGKLLSHMQAIAAAPIIDVAGRGALEGPNYSDAHHLLVARPARESDPIETMAAVVRIFHLLPPAANMFMEQLTRQVCEIEVRLKRVGPTPFTKPLAQYLNKYSKQAAELLAGRLDDARYVRCFRLSLAEDCAPALRSEVEEARSRLLIPHFASDADPVKALAAVQIVRELEAKEPGWLKSHADVVEALLSLWRSAPFRERRDKEAGPREHRLSQQIVEAFCSFLQHEHHSGVYFALADLFTMRSPIDNTPVARLVYQRLAIDGSVAFKRVILRKFVDLYEDAEASQSYKVECLRLLVNPILFATPRAKDAKDAKDGKDGKDAKDVKTEGDKPKDSEAKDKPAEPDAMDVDAPKDGSDGKAVDAKPADGQAPPAPPAEALFDTELFNAVINRIFKAAHNKPGQARLEDRLCVEILHMSTMVLEHCEKHFLAQSGARRDAIRFGWTYLPSEDVTVKHCAYIFIARFLSFLEAPVKITGQVFLGLLRSHQPDGRTTVRKALDILVPALPKRVPAPEPGQPPMWAKWAKRVLQEEGHNIAQVFIMLQLLVRHSDLFYPSREIFLPHIAGNLAKLAFAPSANAETRHLAVELVDLVARWEAKRSEAMEPESEGAEGDAAADPAPRKRRADDGEGDARKRIRTEEGSAAAAPSTPASNAAEHAYAMPQHLRDVMLGFLLRFISLSGDSVSRGTVAKAFTLLKDLLQRPGWKDVQVKLNVFQRALAGGEIKDSNLAVVSNSLQVLKVVTRDKDSAWFLAHTAQLQKLLEKSLASDEPLVLEHSRDVLERIFAALPEAPEEDEDADADGDADGDDDDEEAAAAAAALKAKAAATPADPAAAFRALAEGIISEGLRNSSNLYAAFVVLGSWAKVKPEKIDEHVAALTKALTKLTKEHLAAPSSGTPDQGLKLLILALDLLKTRITRLGEQRRWFLSAVVQLIEKSSSLDLCRYLLLMMRKWILEQQEAFPTAKEKAGILVKMMSFENRDEALLREFLELIHAIYTNPAFARTELTVRLENPFLLGCRHPDPALRKRFLDTFDRTLVRSLPNRMQYLLGQQSWEYLAGHYWIQQALDLLLSSVDADAPLVGGSEASTSSSDASKNAAANTDFARTLRGMTVGPAMAALRDLVYTDSELAHDVWVAFFPAAWRAMPRRYQEDATRALIGVLTREHNLRQVSARPNVVQTLLDGALPCSPPLELPPHVVKYLGKTFGAWHTAVELLQGATQTLPREDDAVREAVQDALGELYADLSEDDLFYGLWRRRCVYAESNAAISYEQNGLWASSQIMYEQAQTKARTGMLAFTEAEYSLWEDHWVLCAQKLQQWDILTDLAKLEGNHDLLLECAWRLSDWSAERDILEQAIDGLSATATPRRRVFAAYMALLKTQAGQDKAADFGRICDEAIQLTLRKWHSLPSHVTQAHVPLLQIFQQFVELQEASTVFASLALTTSANLDQRSAELKTLMQTWRERLPNLWDDINAWSDLVAWRQHVFSAINKAYLPLAEQIQARGAPGASTNSYAYRGFHETAWIINRFAHVARKHYLNDVCISSLNKIYTLPNIEIQEAFLKLREQAKCHYQHQSELAQGLEVINNTNLMFFAAPQKAEFFTLKGMFMARLGLSREADEAFSTAIQMDLTLAKAWTEWGRYNDRNFRDNPAEPAAAGGAVSCYLQAASLYRNSKVRRVLIRILWLLSCDDANGTVSQNFEAFRGEAPVWYWITFIPQLLQSLSHREARHARRLLMQIAKSYPQSLYFYLRTTKEEYIALKRQSLYAAQRAAQQAQARQAAAQQQQQAAAAAAAAATAAASSDDKKEEGGAEASGEEKKDAAAGVSAPATSTPATGSATPAPAASAGDGAATTAATSATPAAPTTGSTPAPATTATPATTAATPAAPATATTPAPAPAATSTPAPAASTPAPAATSTPTAQPAAAETSSTPQAAARSGSQQPAAAATASPANAAAAAAPGTRYPWDHVDEILTILKTAFPLLALTMETMADQVQQRFKPSNDEDIYRLTNALLNDALQQYIQRAALPNDSGQLPSASMANVMRFADNLPPGELKTAFEEDFVKSKPTLRDYVQKLQRWRDKYEGILDRRPSRQHLEHCSHYLVEFQHQRFDEVEVPGQYLKLEDNNSDFVKVSRFLPTYDLTRSSGQCTRRLSLLSNKGSVHSFAVQLPSARYCRREERIFQLLRCLNRILERRKETRKRGLVFTTPAAIPLSPQLRLVESDASFVSLQDVYERHCDELGIGKDDPIMAWVEKMRSTWDGSKGGLVELSNLRMELLDEISTKFVPETVLTRYLTRTMASASDLWLMRKQFTLHMSSTMFLTYVLFISGRLPSRIHISRSSGVVAMSDVVPTLNPQVPQFKSTDATPFRLTPNIQHFMGPIGVEGVVTSSLMAIGRCLSESLEEYLSIFVRDEIRAWLQLTQRQPPGSIEAPRDAVLGNILEVVKRARLLSCKFEIDKPQPSTIPANQTVVDLINSASNIAKLALQDPTFHPWL